MTSDSLIYGEHIPNGMAVPNVEDVKKTLASYGVDCASRIKLIDSTRDASDIRFNFIVDKKYVLRFCNDPALDEKRVGDLQRLIGRYHSFGIACPSFIADSSGGYVHPWKQLKCYLSEYIDLPLASEANIVDEDSLLREVQLSVAGFAKAYKNVDLSKTMGMYSLFDLSPFDIPNGIDEKEENFNMLVELLRLENEDELAKALIARHCDVRKRLRSIYKRLPRCVFQGDENFSNVLVDENGHFAGFIDFNLAGTEVVVNQLANLAGFDYNENCAEPIGPQKRLDYAVDYYESHMRKMLEIYDANDEELQALPLYAWIVMTAQWPTFCYFRHCIGGKLKDEIITLLRLIASIPLEQLTFAKNG